MWLLVAALVLGACNTDIQSGIGSANDLLYRKKYVEAERLYRKLLKRLEGSKALNEAEEAQRLLLLDRLGKVNALYLRDYTQAIADYETLVRRYPKSEQALVARSTAADLYHHRIGNLQAAITEYQQVVAEYPSRPEARTAQLETVAAYFQLKNYEQARTEAKTLLTRYPDSAEAAQARFEIADSYYVQKRYEQAIAAYEGLLKTNPDATLTGLVLFELGNCYQEMGEAERALTYYYACLPDHPNPALVQRKIQRLRSRLHNTTPAASILTGQHLDRRVAAVRPHPELEGLHHHPAPLEPEAQTAVPGLSAGENDAPEERTSAPVAGEEAHDDPPAAGQPDPASGSKGSSVP